MVAAWRWTRRHNGQGMANTKNLDPKARKQAKRKMRNDQKQQLLQLTLRERKQLRKFEGTTKQFLTELEAKKRQAAAAAAAAPAEAAATEAAPPAEGGEES